MVLKNHVAWKSDSLRAQAASCASQMNQLVQITSPTALGDIFSTIINTFALSNTPDNRRYNIQRISHSCRMLYQATHALLWHRCCAHLNTSYIDILLTTYIIGRQLRLILSPATTTLSTAPGVQALASKQVQDQAPKRNETSRQFRELKAKIEKLAWQLVIFVYTLPV